MQSKFRWLNIVQWFLALLLLAAASGAFAFGTAAKFVLLTNQDSAYSETGTGWQSVTPPAVAGANPTFYGEFYRVQAGTGGSETATARWDFGNLAPSPGQYSFDAFIPDNGNNSGLSVTYRVESAPFSLFTGCGTYSTLVTFNGVNADNSEGRWVHIGNQDLEPGFCYRLVLSNQLNAGAILIANAVRAERLFESSATITDMPRLANAFTAGITFIGSNSNASPTIVSTLTVTCPQTGQVMVIGNGESAAQSGIDGTSFIGVAYSIAKNSAATDNGNVVQSSALAVFNGDANRDFLFVKRTDTCTRGETITYRLTAYRSQAGTSTSSFIWNAGLSAQYFPQTF
jgi:hypothetical protein